MAEADSHGTVLVAPSVPIGGSEGGAGTRSASNGEQTQKKKKLLVLNAFIETCSGHQSPGLWKHPDDRSSEFNNIEHWVELAKKLEDAKFHGMFIADVLGAYDVYKKSPTPAFVSGAQWPVNEPLLSVPAMAAATKSIGFGVTVSTTYEPPYHLARRLSTVDHYSKGRLGWNIVTGYLDSASRNLLGKDQPQHDNRYEVAEEYMKVMYKLFESSWRDDAVVLDAKNTKYYSDPDRIRYINHDGEYYNVPGPHLSQPSPQRTPLLYQAGTSTAGKKFAAQHAEAVFVGGFSPQLVSKNIAEIRDMAEKDFGRDRNDIKFLALICPVLGKTEEEANAKFEEFLSYGDTEGALALFGGWTGIDMNEYDDDQELRDVGSNAIRSAVESWSTASPKVKRWTKKVIANQICVGGLGFAPTGTPQQVADELEDWVNIADVDGFNICYAVYPKTFDDVIEMLVPELRKRGMFHDDYEVPGGTYRENFYAKKGQTGPLDAHVAAKYRWKAGVAAADHKIPE